MLNPEFDPLEILISASRAIVDLDQREQQLKRNELQLVHAYNDLSQRVRVLEQLLLNKNN